MLQKVNDQVSRFWSMTDFYSEESAPPDPRSLHDPVDITSKIPSEFHTDIASSKWKERKATLDALLEAVNNTPRIIDTDSIGEVAKALAKRMSDANIMCVITASNIVEGLSRGVGNGFGSKYRSILVPSMLERFKERKQNVVDAIGAGLDALFETVCPLFPRSAAEITDVYQKTDHSTRCDGGHTNVAQVEESSSTRRNSQTPRPLSINNPNTTCKGGCQANIGNPRRLDG